MRRLFSCCTTNKRLLQAVIICVSLWLACQSSLLKAQSAPTPRRQNMEQLWRWGGLISALTPVGDTLYVGMGGDLVIFDITDPATPTLLGQLELGVSINQIAIMGAYALLATNDAGLFIIDLTDQHHPQLVAERPDPATVHTIAVNGRYVYVTYAATDPVVESGVQILDLSQPATPIVRNPWIAGLEFTPTALQIAQGQLFVAGGNFYYTGEHYDTWGALQAFDLTDPVTPSPLPAYHTERTTVERIEPTALQIHGDSAFVIRYDRILRFALDTPAQLRPTAQLTLDGIATGSIAATGEYFYVTSPPSDVDKPDNNAGLYILDIQNPATMTVSGFMAQRVNAVAVQRHYAFIGRADDGLHSFDLSEPRRPRAIGQSNALVTSGWGDLVTQGHVLYATGGYLATPLLSTIDLHNPTTPTLTQIFTGTDWQAYYPFIADQWLIVPAAGSVGDTYDGYHLFDLAKPTVPQWRRQQKTTPFTTAAYANHQIYLETLTRTPPTAEVHVLDVSVPTEPVDERVIALTPKEVFTPFNDFSVSERYLYTVGNRDPQSAPPWITPRLAVYDLATAQTIASLALPRMFVGLYHDGDTLYGIAQNETPPVGTVGDPTMIYLIDVAVPTQPSIRQHYAWDGEITDLLRADHLLYIATRDVNRDQTGLAVLDFTIPHAPGLAGYARQTGYLPQLAAIDDTIYFLGDRLGAYRYTPPQATTRLDQGGTLVAVADGVTYTFPSTTFAAPVTVTHTTRFVDPLLALPAPQLGVGNAFVLQALITSTGSPVAPLGTFAMTIQYTKERVQWVDETTLTLYRWADGAWVAEPSVVDPATQTVTATLETTGVWLLGARAKNRLYLPLIHHGQP